jgi:hypothetical protein
MAGDTTKRPTFNGASTFFGWMGKHGRHILYGAPIQPKGGDYGNLDQDQVGGPGAGGAAQAYPRVTQIIDGSGNVVSSFGGGGGGGGGGGSSAPYAATPKGYQQITGTGAVAALTVPAGATFAVVQPEAQGVRYRDDGTNPTAAVGMPIGSGVSVTFGGAIEEAALKFWLPAGAILDINYYA